MKRSVSVVAAGLLAVAGLAGAAGGSPAQDTPRADPAAAAAASNAFGFDLYRALSRTTPADRGLFMSPYSVSVAMTMAAEGARGKTGEEMARVLRMPEGELRRVMAAQHEAYAALAARLRDAAGSTDPEQRARLARLREQLAEANAKTERANEKNDYGAARASGERARKLADEVNALQATLDRFQLRVANALWVERTFGLVPAYSQTLSRYYGAGLTPLNIAGDVEGSRRTINAWVEKQTENRIKDLIPAGVMKPDIRLVLTNAVYFLGEWQQPFEKSRTRDEDFTLAGGEKIKVKMMIDGWRGGVPYAAFNGDGTYFETPREVPEEESERPPTYPGDEGFALIELPYKGGELAMVVIAPRSPDGLPELEGKLTAESLAEWVSKLEARRVDTGVPRFGMESEFDLGGVLQGMGMTRAFVNPALPDGAEFDGMSDSADPAKRLFIGAVRHKAWVAVNEKGTEAAAATAVLMAPGAAMRPQKMIPFDPVFRADRPFLFVIRDRVSGVVLFVGRCVRPG